MGWVGGVLIRQEVETLTLFQPFVWTVVIASSLVFQLFSFALQRNPVKTTSSYKINEYEGYNMQYDKYSEHCCMLYMKLVRVNPDFSPQGETTIFLFFYFVSR